MKTTRVCEVCGEEFEPRRKDQRGCSAACAREIKRRMGLKPGELKPEEK